MICVHLCADVGKGVRIEEVTSVAAVSQRPAAAAAFNQLMPVQPAWHDLPTWYVPA